VEPPLIPIAQVMLSEMSPVPEFLMDRGFYYPYLRISSRHTPFSRDDTQNPRKGNTGLCSVGMKGTTCRASNLIPMMEK
jgi:hypothetical protein